MIQMQTKLEVADNSGAKKIMCMTVIGQGKKIAHVGDIVKCAVQEALPDGTVKKGQVVDAVGQKCDLHLRRAGVTLVDGIGFDDRLLFVFQHGFIHLSK